jgi:hypothetical protein
MGSIAIMNKYILDPKYRQSKVIEKEVRAKFDLWESTLNSVKYLSPELSLQIMKRFDIRFPRIIFQSPMQNLKLYRARYLPEDSNEDISKQSTFSYPPKENATSYQRANAPGHPVFYGALDGKTALEELIINGDQKIKPGDKIYLSEWKLKSSNTVNLSNLTHPSINRDEQLLSPMTKRIFSDFSDIFRDEDYDFMYECLNSYKLISSLFLNESKSYLKSGSIAYDILFKTIMDKKRMVDGILYPSCSNRYRSGNCALHPDFVDENLELVNVRKIVFKEYISKGAQGNYQFYGFPDGKNVNWKSFASEFDYDNIQIDAQLSEVWDKHTTRISDFYLHGKKTNLQHFCLNRIQNIDSNRPNIDEKMQNVFFDESGLILINELKFDKNIAYIKHKGNKNFVDKIWIKLPLNTFMDTVESAFVKNN